MKSYRGYYIDHIIFNSEADIDNMIKENNVRTYKIMCKHFANHPSMELSMMMSKKADWLHEYCGLSYEELEEIEISAYEDAA